MAGVRVAAWQVHDTGLVAAPGPFRRLPGAVRHHQGRGDPWPAEVVLTLEDGELRVDTSGGEPVGRWPLADVHLRLVGEGPPVTFVVQLPAASHLLAAPASEATRALLAALA